MPRKTIPISQKIDYLSVLDDDGHADPDCDPHLSRELLIDLYHAMLLGRRFDERLLNLQRQGRVGTFAPTRGQEAAHLGAAAALEDEDWMVPSFREVPAELYRGVSLESVLLRTAGAFPDPQDAADTGVLPVSIPVASQVLHAVGIAWAMRYRRRQQVVMCFFGDGATSQGDFHEGLNFAGVFQVPAVFVCQNNHWAISTPVSHQTRSETIAQKAAAYGMPGLRVDGNDILAVYSAAREAVQRARSGKGPSLIEAVTYRMAMHTTADDPRRYRSDDEVDRWQRRDPLVRFGRYLRRRKVITDEQMAEMETKVKARIQTAVERAEQRIPALDDPLQMFDHAYATLPRHLEAQREMLFRRVRDATREVKNG